MWQAILESLGGLFRASGEWLVKQGGKLLVKYVAPSLLKQVGLSYSAQLAFVGLFVVLVNHYVNKLISEANSYIITLFSFNDMANSLWLSFVSLLPVTIYTNFQIIVSSAATVIGIRLMILYAKMFINASASKESANSKK
ncbi:TPA: hypothetical protein P5S08_003734 [Salmonella enterica subsp. enterica serovar Concord]|nr:hypothetical protein [Salmonella enterica subsp. enterica serovar Concord]